MLLNEYTRHSILDVWRGAEHTSAEKQGKCKMCKNNSQRRYVKSKNVNLRDIYFELFQY